MHIAQSSWRPMVVSHEQEWVSNSLGPAEWADPRQQPVLSRCRGGRWRGRWRRWKGRDRMTERAVVVALTCNGCGPNRWPT